MNSKAILSLLCISLLALSAFARPQTDDEVEEVLEGDENDEETTEMEEGEVVAEEEEDENYDGLVKVEAPVGTIYGVESEDEAKQYRFLGIPYAEPPVGTLRFMDPVPKPRFEKPLKATDFGSVCPQKLQDSMDSHDEDCLFLNIFTPRLPAFRDNRNPPKSSLLPVIVLIHGGGFNKGSGNTDPSALVAEDVIVVSFNYRLGILGFLSLGNPMIPGNAGLKDQLEALRWVKANIMAFGGDPNKITLSGFSAGSVSAHLHMISPQGQGLYNGVIGMSANALTISEKLRKGTAISDGIRFAEDNECLGAAVEEVVQCLQDMSVEDLVSKTQGSKDSFEKMRNDINGTGDYKFLPVLDGFSFSPFLPEDPIQVLEQGKQKDLPFINGMTAHEGGFFVAKHWNSLEDVSSNWTYFGPKLIYDSSPRDVTEKQKVVADVIKHFYTAGRPFSQDLKNELITMISDMFYTIPTIKGLELMSSTQNQPVYFYVFNHKPSRSFLEKYVPEGEDGTSFGVAHGDDFLMIFKQEKFPNAISTDEDKMVQKTLVSLFTNFAKYQDPTPFQEDNMPTWVPFTVKDPNALEISTDSKIMKDYARTRVHFWNKFYWDDVIQDGKSSVPVVGSVIPQFLPPPAINFPSSRQRLSGQNGRILPQAAVADQPLPFPFFSGPSYTNNLFV